MIQREWQRIDPKYLDDDEQRFWATIAGRQIRFDQRAEFAQEVRRGPRGQGRARDVPRRLRRREPEPPPADDRARRPRRDARRARRLRRPRHARHARRRRGRRIAPRASASCCARSARGRPLAPDQILARWTWRLARATRKVQDRRVSSRVPRGEAPARRRRQLARPPPRGERRPARPGRAASCRSPSARRCSRRPTATRRARTARSTTRARSSARSREIANALAENLPAPKATGAQVAPAAPEAQAARLPTAEAQTAEHDGEPQAPTVDGRRSTTAAEPRSRRRRARRLEDAA